ncbi:MAG: hypothetical protein FD188_3507 [Ignavibacteria bacterium]|nr:MAG: hypothetical protein FD188_3507 [Ignavibacteria bacterium]
MSFEMARVVKQDANNIDIRGCMQFFIYKMHCHCLIYNGETESINIHHYKHY